MLNINESCYIVFLTMVIVPKFNVAGKYNCGDKAKRIFPFFDYCQVPCSDIL